MQRDKPLWQKRSDQKTRDWDATVAYANSLTLAGYSDWRLPTREEILELFGSRYGPYDNKQVEDVLESYFPRGRASCLWSSTTFQGSFAYVYPVCDNGHVDGHGKENAYGALCVRRSRSPSKSPPETDLGFTARDSILVELSNHFAASDEECRNIEQRLMTLGPQCLNILKDIARDHSVELNLRKEAIACAVTFDDASITMFLAEFVNGKNPSVLYKDYENGNSKAGEEYGLFRTAKEYLEKAGHTFTVTPPRV
jgi:Protein of unknown function (DUF1566)